MSSVGTAATAAVRPSSRESVMAASSPLFTEWRRAAAAERDKLPALSSSAASSSAASAVHPFFISSPPRKAYAAGGPFMRLDAGRVGMINYFILIVKGNKDEVPAAQLSG